VNNLLGEIAAIGTAICWSFTSTFFTIGGRHVGSVVVNRARLLLAIVFLSFTHMLIHGELFPYHAEPFRWGWLGLSGIIGLALGDAALFQAFVLVGPQVSMLLMSLVPIISALIAWIFLNETLSLVRIGAIVLTIVGIIIVVFKKRSSKSILNRKFYTAGILLGIGGAFGQAIGLIAAKKGLAGNFSGLSATLMRVLSAAVILWIFTLIIRQGKTTVLKLRNKKALAAIAAGAFVGPFLGIWLSMIAIKFTYVGVASTLMALPPIFLLPLSYWFFKEKITLQSVFGTLIAVAGTAIIFLT